MQQADFRRFHALLTGMAKLYEREIDDVVLDAYWLALRDWPLQEFEAGAAQLMRTAKFMPRPADFTALRKAALPTKGEAWAAVLQHLKGGYRNGAGLTPEIDAAVRPLGGYKALAFMPLGEMHWQEKRFSEHYGEAAEVREVRAPLQLPDLAARITMWSAG